MDNREAAAVLRKQIEAVDALDAHRSKMATLWKEPTPVIGEGPRNLQEAQRMGAEALEFIEEFEAHLRTLADGAAETTRNEYETGNAHGMQSVLDHWERLRAARKAASK